MGQDKKESIFSQIPKPALIGGGLIIVLLIIAIVFFVSSGDDQTKKSKKDGIDDFGEQVIEEKTSIRKIDGVKVHEGDANRPIIGIMIENHIEARPQSGLAEANLVIEAPVEGGITRYLAFYDLSEEIEFIGPVRSARPYYLDWSQSIASVYAHVGGSPEALRKIKSYDFLDLDQFYKSQYFWRSNDRFAPHNVYTSSTLLKRALEDYEITEPKDYDMISYKTSDRKLSGEEVAEITIAYSTTDEHKVRWTYDDKTNKYTRHLNGDIDKDRETQKMITANNVLVLDYPILIIDEVGRRRIDTLGEGKAKYFLDGVLIEGEWRQENKSDRLRFFTNEGEELAINPGTTWIEVVDVFEKLSY